MKFINVTVLAVLAGVSLFGQTSAINGEIQGTITDPTGAVVPKVNVEILNDGTGFKRSIETSESGFFRFPLLPLGSYTLNAQISGFAPQKRGPIVLSAGAPATINVELSVADTQRSITVTSEAPVIEPSRTDLGSSVSTNTLANVAADRPTWNSASRAKSTPMDSRIASTTSWTAATTRKAIARAFA
jgi:hypothetical protein